MSALCFAAMLASAAVAAEPRSGIEAPRLSLGTLEHDLESIRSTPRGDRAVPARARPGAEPGFVRSYLMPRLSSRFDGLAPRHPVIESADDRVDQLLYDSLTHAARRSAERGARDALKNFLIDTTAIGRLFGRKAGRSTPSSAEAPRPVRPARSSSDFGVGISGGRPELEWSYRSDANSVRVRVDVDGRAGLSFSRSRLSETNVSVAYNPSREQYSLFFSLGF